MHICTYVYIYVHTMSTGVMAPPPSPGHPASWKEVLRPARGRSKGNKQKRLRKVQGPANCRSKDILSLVGKAPLPKILCAKPLGGRLRRARQGIASWRRVLGPANCRTKDIFPCLGSFPPQSLHAKPPRGQLRHPPEGIPPQGSRSYDQRTADPKEEKKREK